MMPDRFLSQTQLQAIEFLERCVRDLEPLTALAGGAGSGKTVALNVLLSRHETAASRIIRVNNFVAGPLSLHRVLASSFGVMDAGDLSAEALEPVLRRALVEAGRSEPPVLAVDDAQSLLPETLRYLCLLAGLREAGRPLIRIVLAGRPGFVIRQSMPRQFTLEALTPDDALGIVRHGFETAGVVPPEGLVQDIVRNGEGNLRRLDALLTTGIETARVAGRRHPGTRRGQAGATVKAVRPARRSAAGRWLMVPALLVAGAGAVAVAYHEGMFASDEPRPAEVAVVTPSRAVAAVQPPQPSVVPPAAGLPPAAPATVSVPLPVPTPLQPPSPAPQPSGIDPSVAAVVPPPVVQAPAPQAAPAQTPPADASSPDTVVPAAPPPVSPGATRFRVYNVSSCHQGVCPRWSVTDIDQGQHFVTAFNPASLHLDRDLLQRVRAGAVDLVVSGSIAQNGSDGRTLNADALQSVAPHHGRPHPASDAGSDPIELAPTQLQSPPPGFLPVPPPTH